MGGGDEAGAAGRADRVDLRSGAAGDEGGAVAGGELHGVVVAVKIGAHAAGAQHRGQRRDQIRLVVARPAAGGVHRMVADHDLPARAAGGKSLAQPGQLRRRVLPGDAGGGAQVFADEGRGVEEEQRRGGSVPQRQVPRIVPRRQLPADGAGGIGDLRRDIAAVVVIAQHHRPGALQRGLVIDVLVALTPLRVIDAGDAVFVEIVSGRDDPARVARGGGGGHGGGDGALVVGAATAPVADQEEPRGGRGGGGGQGGQRGGGEQAATGQGHAARCSLPPPPGHVTCR
jgi:hypothetical protein